MKRIFTALAAAAALAGLTLAVPAAGHAAAGNVALAAASSAHPGKLAPGVHLNGSVRQPSSFPPGVWRPAYGLHHRTTTPGDAAVCIFVKSIYCIVSNGQGNLDTLEYNQAANWTFVAAGACNYCYTVHNGNNNCMAENTSDYVYTMGTSCDQSWSPDVIEAFTSIVNGETRWAFWNTGRGNWYGVWDPPHGGQLIRGDQVQGGYDSGWKIQCCPG